MTRKKDELDKIRMTTRPVIFQTGVAAAPYSIAGSAFLVGFEGAVFVVTANHVVNNYPPEKIVIYPSNSSKRCIRVIRWWRFNGDANDCDYADILLIQADMSCIPKKERVGGRLLFLTRQHSSDWLGSRFTSKFFLCGHPTDINDVDYSIPEINTRQVLLVATYMRPSASSGCHTIKAENPLSLSSFNGLSGSPVFSIQGYHPFIAGQPAKPKFCGMVLRGSAESGMIHFLAADSIIEALQEASNRLRYEV